MDKSLNFLNFSIIHYILCDLFHFTRRNNLEIRLNDSRYYRRWLNNENSTAICTRDTVLHCERLQTRDSTNKHFYRFFSQLMKSIRKYRLSIKSS